MRKKTLESIVESGNDFIIQVKGNCPALHRHCQHIKDKRVSNNFHSSEEKNRGRIEKRETKVYPFFALGKMRRWHPINSIIIQKRMVSRLGKESMEYHYYATNKSTPDAKKMATGIRGHWSIENNLHWVKDVILNEDKNNVKGGHLAEIQSTLRNIIVNIYRLGENKSVKSCLEKYTNRLEECLHFIYNKNLC